jgi:hypothetical protein
MSASDKGGKGNAEGEEEESTEEETTEESTEMTAPPSAKKSLEDAIAGNDTEAEVAMDIEPYLKALAHEIGVKLEKSTKPLDRFSKLEKSVEELSTIVKAIGKTVLANAEMQKSISDNVTKFGQIEIPSMTRLRKSTDRFQVEGSGEMSVMEIMAKATELCRTGQLSTTDVTILEGRLQHGGDIPESMKPLFVKKA